MTDQNVTFKYEYGSNTTEMKFCIDEVPTSEMFMQWVKFMNAIGYVLDPVEMEDMWNGEK